jgi:hypothetical protein
MCGTLRNFYQMVGLRFIWSAIKRPRGFVTAAERGYLIFGEATILCAWRRFQCLVTGATWSFAGISTTALLVKRPDQSELSSSLSTLRI